LRETFVENIQFFGKSAEGAKGKQLETLRQRDQIRTKL
jgi:hypothetical protein